MTDISTDRRSSDKLEAGTRAARLAAVQALYEIDVTGAKADDVVVEYLGRRWRDLPESVAAGPLDTAKFKRLFRGVCDQRSRLDEMITGAMSEDRGAERLDILLRSLLRAAVFELAGHTDTPARVIIHEYVGLAHAFFAGGEPNLVNGVLDKLGHVLRPGELER